MDFLTGGRGWKANANPGLTKTKWHWVGNPLSGSCKPTSRAPVTNRRAGCHPALLRAPVRTRGKTK